MAIKVGGTTVIDDSRNLSNIGIITATTINATTITGDGSGLTGAGSTVGDDTSTNATFYPVLTQTTSGTITASNVSTTKLSFNPSTGTLSATTFSGALTGTATTSTSATVTTSSTNSNFKIPFADTTANTTGNYGLLQDTESTFTYNPSTNTLTAGIIIDAQGDIRDIPQNSKTSSYILVASDTGKHVSITTGGVTVPSNVFSAGESVAIYNNSSSNQTITQGSGVTLRLAGSSNTGNRTLSQYGICTILCVSSNVFVITGSGLS